MSGLKTSTFPISKEYKVKEELSVLPDWVDVGVLGGQGAHGVCHHGGELHEKTLQGNL